MRTLKIYECQTDNQDFITVQVENLDELKAKIKERCKLHEWHVSHICVFDVDLNDFIGEFAARGRGYSWQPSKNSTI